MPLNWFREYEDFTTQMQDTVQRGLMELGALRDAPFTDACKRFLYRRIMYRMAFWMIDNIPTDAIARAAGVPVSEVYQSYQRLMTYVIACMRHNDNFVQENWGFTGDTAYEYYKIADKIITISERESCMQFFNEAQKFITDVQESINIAYMVAGSISDTPYSRAIKENIFKQALTVFIRDLLKTIPKNIFTDLDGVQITEDDVIESYSGFLLLLEKVYNKARDNINEITRQKNQKQRTLEESINDGGDSNTN